jgi:hypothetical protein
MLTRMSAGPDFAGPENLSVLGRRLIASFTALLAASFASFRVCCVQPFFNARS